MGSECIVNIVEKKVSSTDKNGKYVFNTIYIYERLIRAWLYVQFIC